MKIDEKYFQSDMKQNSVEDLLLDGERVLFKSKPKRSAYMWAAILKMLPLAVVWLAIDTSFIVMLATQVASGIPKAMIAVICVFFAIHLAPVWMWIYNIVKASLEFKNIEYAFTDKRIFVRKGIIPDINFVFYEKIQSVNAKVGVIDRLLKVGDLYITAPSQAIVLFDQSNPYQLASKLQRVVQDIQSDVNYPNALRPQNNPGYNTTYEPFEELNESVPASVSAASDPLAGDSEAPLAGDNAENSSHPDDRKRRP